MLEQNAQELELLVELTKGGKLEHAIGNVC